MKLIIKMSLLKMFSTVQILLKEGKGNFALELL